MLVANLLCRVPDPAACLAAMSGPDGLVKKGGLLVVTTPCRYVSVTTPCIYARYQATGCGVRGAASKRRSND